MWLRNGDSLHKLCEVTKLVTVTAAIALDCCRASQRCWISLSCTAVNALFSWHYQASAIMSLFSNKREERRSCKELKSGMKANTGSSTRFFFFYRMKMTKNINIYSLKWKKWESVLREKLGELLGKLKICNYSDIKGWRSKKNNNTKNKQCCMWTIKRTLHSLFSIVTLQLVLQPHKNTEWLWLRR